MAKQLHLLQYKWRYPETATTSKHNSRGTKGRKCEEQLRISQKPHMKPQTRKEYLQQRTRLRTTDSKTAGGGA